MRKVLGVLVRAPTTTVEIDPPAYGSDQNLTPEDAILRALYSYKSPEDYATQASWLKLKEKDKGFLSSLGEFLTKKRYTLQLPSISEGSSDKKEDRTKIIKTKDGVIEYSTVDIQQQAIKLSNLEAGVALAVVSYPAAYGYYNYESYREEEVKSWTLVLYISDH